MGEISWNFRIFYKIKLTIGHFGTSVGWAVPKALHGKAPLFDQKLLFPTKLGPTKNFKPSKFHFNDT